MKAYSLIRRQPWYRREAFLDGLKAAGHQVKEGPPREMGRDTLVLMWNRYAENHELACRVEAAGGTVLVAENGYLGLGGSTPKFDVIDGVQSGHYYALAIGGHNGSGLWQGGGPERFNALGVELKDWRMRGEHVLVCPSRNFGRPDMLMPSMWLEQTLARLKKLCGQPVRVRQHPGNGVPSRPLTEDLRGAAAVVIWASSAGVHALSEGIPVICYAPRWILKQAAFDDFTEFYTLFGKPDVMERLEAYRRTAFERMAWAQWSVEEISRGEPFHHLLSDARQGQGQAVV